MRALVLVALVGCGHIYFDPLDDAGSGDGSRTDAADDAQTPRVLYAASQSQLFRIDPVTLARTPVMVLCPNVAGVQLADIAISSAGTVLAPGLANTALYLVAPNGTCTLVANLAVRMFGLEFMPPGVVAATEELVGAGDNGSLYRVNPQTGAVTLIGAIGALPGGDLTWTGSSALITTQAGATNNLARLDLMTGAATAIGDTTYNSVTGLVWYGGELFGFAGNGTIFAIDPATGAPTRTQSTPELWAGATIGD